MTILVEDTARNTLAAWVVEALESGVVDGATTSPFSSPYSSTSYKPSCQRVSESIRSAGGQFWFDAATYALAIPAVGDFRYYEQWDLWGGDRGDLSQPALVRDHVLRVFAIQEELHAPLLAPSVLLHAPMSSDTATAVALAAEAVAEGSTASITIAGTPAFWAAGSDLDAVIGTFAQLGASGYFLVVVRPAADLPPNVDSSEIAGLCRTSRSLAEFGPVHISHGDFAAVPAVAAGASSVGTGWDSRQRVCNYSSYVARDVGGGGGGWLKRPTFERLLGSMSRADAERLFRQDAALADRLYRGQLHPDGPKEAFLHHAGCLRRVTETVRSAPSYKDRYRATVALYADAVDGWAAAATAAGVSSLAGHCVDPLRAGLDLYAVDEGWA